MCQKHPRKEEYMLNTQVQYWALQETKRHDLVTESIQRDTLNESIRHNTKSESQIDFQNMETQRHNMITEQFNWSTLNESIRHNKQMEGIGWTNAKAAQTQAAASMKQAQAALQNAATNRVNAQTQQRLADIQQQNANTQEKNAQTNFLNYVSSSSLNSQRIKESKANIKLKRQQLTLQKHQTAQGWVNSAAKASDSGANWLDALIPM